MDIRSFKDLLIWQKANVFSVEVYKTFSNSRDFSFRDQIQRAAISIPNNIAEGYARQSDRAFRNFLFIAKGSAAEVESMLSAAQMLGYITKDKEKLLASTIHEIYKMINGFMKKL